MEIRNILSKEMDGYAKLERLQTSRQEEAARKPAAAARDRATVSSEARIRGEAFSSALSAATVRYDRVNELRSQLEKGEYSIDPRAIAEKMLGDDRLFLG